MEEVHRDVLVTGMGAVCAVAGNRRSLWEAIECGRDGIAPIRRFPVDGFKVQTGALVEDGSADGYCGASAEDLCRKFAWSAAREALEDDGPDPRRTPASRRAMVFGTGLVGASRPIHRLIRALADDLGLHGPCIVISTACSSSNAAMGVARDLLAMDAADLVVAGGADVLSPEVFAGFHALGVLSPSKCAPFSTPLGTSIGEGAGFVVLERTEDARARGVRGHAFLSGSGISGDAFHETSPDPTGSGVERALRSALQDAALAPEAVGYVNAHGSGTEANDPAEWRGIQRGLGGHAGGIPVSSAKGALGHAQGAAGVLEAIVTILAMEHGVAPPTLHFNGARPYAPSDPVAGPKPRTLAYEHALCLNSAFGGANAAIILSRSRGTTANRRRRPVFVWGVGEVGPGGLGDEAFSRNLSPDRRAAGRVPRFSLATIVPTANSRGLDPMSRYLAAATAQALRDAGVVLRGTLRGRAGLFVAAVTPSPESSRAFRRSIEERGLHGISAAAFARVVLNAPAGFCSKMLSLRGPLSTLSTGPGGGLVSIALAAEYLSSREDIDCIATAGVDELDPLEETGEVGSEGASCLLIGVGGGPDGSGVSGIQVTGWGIAGPSDLDDAVRRARGGAAPLDERVYRVEDWAPCGSPETAVVSSAACAAAVRELRSGVVERALVTSASGSATVAIALQRVEGRHDRRS